MLRRHIYRVERCRSHMLIRKPKMATCFSSFCIQCQKDACSDILYVSGCVRSSAAEVCPVERAVTHNALVLRGGTLYSPWSRQR